MTRDRIAFLFLNLGHFFDHFLVLVFATVAALALAAEWQMSYGALIPYATPGFVAFGLCALPAGWIADKWSREGMMIIFFLGIGASTLLTSLAQSPLQISAGLLAVGIFAAIYHPVGLAMVVQGRTRTGLPLAVNGIFGNMGVAAAALVSGLLIDLAGWRAAFALPGAAALLTGLAYVIFLRSGRHLESETAAGAAERRQVAGGGLAVDRATVVRVLAIVFLSTGIGGLIFQSTTFALPKIFDERLTALAGSASAVGWYAFLVFALAAFAQLVVGYLVDHHPVRAVFAAVAGLQAVFFAVMYELTGPAALFVSVAFMLVVFGQIPINDVLVARVSKSEWRSRVYACRYVVTFSVMASAIPLVAWLHANWGFAGLFAILAGAAAVIFLAVLQLPAALAATNTAPEPGTA